MTMKKVLLILFNLITIAGMAAGRGAVEFRIAYLKKMKELLRGDKTVGAFADAMKQAYPGLPGEAGLEELGKHQAPPSRRYILRVSAGTTSKGRPRHEAAHHRHGKRGAASARLCRRRRWAAKLIYPE